MNYFCTYRQQIVLFFYHLLLETCRNSYICLFIHDYEVIIKVIQDFETEFLVMFYDAEGEN